MFIILSWRNHTVILEGCIFAHLRFLAPTASQFTLSLLIGATRSTSKNPKFLKGKSMSLIDTLSNDSGPHDPAADADSANAVSRRRFMTLLSASAASFAVQGCGGTGAAGEARADAFLASSGIGGPITAPVLTPQGAGITSFKLTSPTAGSSLPFSVGHAFKKGDVAAGSRLIGSISDLQVTWKNTWPDGSLKFGVIAGRANLMAGIPLTVTLSIGVGSTIANLTTDNLRTTGVTASVDAGAFGSATWTAADWASPFVNWISGPFMSSWIYRKPVGIDPHLVAWLEVRMYRGGAVEVLPWIENGYLNVPNPTNKSAVYAFSMGGTQRFSGAFDLPNHCRTVLMSGAGLSHWLGTAPVVTPIHDKAYLQATGLVPTYRASVPSSAAVWANLVTTYSPLQQGNYANSMGQPGYHGAIGLLPEWDVLYLVSNDPRAYAGVVINAYSAGRYGIHYRDEKTLRPFRFSSYPNLVVDGGDSTGIGNTGASTKNAFTPAASGVAPAAWDSAHHPSVGFTAYLLTGSFYFMEEVQFAATINFLKNTDITRKFSAGVFLSNAGANITRGAAWAIRTLAQAACITPDDDVLRPEFISSMSANVDFYHATYVAQPNNPFGFVAPYSNYTGGSGTYSEAAWMQDFFTAAVGYAIDVDPGMAASSNSKLAAFFAWKAQSIIGRLGGITPSEYLYRDAAVYTIAVAPSESPDYATGAGPWYANWGELYRATLGTANPGVDGPLRGGNFPAASSYWGNLQPAIAYAVHHNVPGAMAAYTRMISAANWNQLASDFNTTPVWSVVPNMRAVAATPPPSTVALPAWVPPAGYFADVPMVNAPQDVIPGIYQNYAGDTVAMDFPFIMWGGSAILRDFSERGAQVYYAAGHEASPTRSNIQLSLICDFSTLTWSVANVPMQANAANTFVNGMAADGTPYAPHTYLGLQEFPKAWGGGTKGSLASFFWAGNAWENKINVLDVSRPTMGYSQLATRQAQNPDPSKIVLNTSSTGGDYPITVQDQARRGWWVAAAGGMTYTLFVSNTGDITQYPALGGNLANGALVLCPSLNLLIAVDGGYSVGANAGTGYRTMHIRDLSTSVVTRSTTLGNVPSLSAGYDGTPNIYNRPDVMGLQWIEELGCIVGFDQTAVPPTIVKLTPPAGNPATGSWTWSTVTVAHWPQDSGGQPVLQMAMNNIWSKFRWVPSLQGFVYATAKDRKPQVVRIA
jgi:hypothetical protein